MIKTNMDCDCPSCKWGEYRDRSHTYFCDLIKGYVVRILSPCPCFIPKK